MMNASSVSRRRRTRHEQPWRNGLMIVLLVLLCSKELRGEDNDDVLLINNTQQLENTTTIFENGNATDDGAKKNETFAITTVSPSFQQPTMPPSPTFPPTFPPLIDASEIDWTELETVPFDLSCNRNDWYGCGEQTYCTFSHGLKNLSWCTACPRDLQQCNLTALEKGYPQQAVDDCWYMCGYAQLDQPCSWGLICSAGEYFCDTPDFDWNHTNGICTACPEDRTTCLELESEAAQIDCIMCDLLCHAIFDVQIEGYNDEYDLRTYWVKNSPYLNATGPLVNCSASIKKGKKCKDAQDAICMVEENPNELDAYYLEWINKCRESGGVGMLIIFYRDMDAVVPRGSVLDIPATGIVMTRQEKQEILKPLLGQTTTLTAIGTYCEKVETCSYPDIPCVAYYSGMYCDSGGYCEYCPLNEKNESDPFQCFFEVDDYRDQQVTPESIASCASVCGGALEFRNCKFCPTDVTGFEFGDIQNDRCEFCPANDVQFPKRQVSIFGNAKCWQVQEFFRTVEIDSATQNCQLLQMYNYVCGCAGPGYGGANTHTKKVVLAWLPRVMAILSVLGSAFIIYDATRGSAREQRRRRQVFNDLVVVLSLFDIIGGIAYAFTTLPIPETEYIYGAAGNDATCTTQGFFIQIGTISCFMNVSLAVYYLLVITWGWSEHRVKKSTWILIAAPILVGLGFAFGGIPFYDNTILWCNNSAELWPDIPVAAAIFFATIIMAVVCLDVWQKERQSARWRGAGAGRASSRLSQKVFWQSFWYLMAFYVTWPPYLALQFFLASGTAYTEYGLILAAGAMVPLQGFWNFFVYIRPRYLSKVGDSKRRSNNTRTAAATSVGMNSGRSTTNSSWVARMIKRTNSRDSMDASKAGAPPAAARTVALTAASTTIYGGGSRNSLDDDGGTSHSVKSSCENSSKNDDKDDSPAVESAPAPPTTDATTTGASLVMPSPDDESEGLLVAANPDLATFGAAGAGASDNTTRAGNTTSMKQHHQHHHTAADTTRALSSSSSSLLIMEDDDDIMKDCCSKDFTAATTKSSSTSANGETSSSSASSSSCKDDEHGNEDTDNKKQQQQQQPPVTIQAAADHVKPTTTTNQLLRTNGMVVTMEQLEVIAPPGPLKISVNNTDQGLVVYEVDQDSPLHGKLAIGDRIVSIERLDTKGITEEALAEFMQATAHSTRRLVVESAAADRMEL